MKITLVLMDDTTMTYDEKGLLVGCTDEGGRIEDPTYFSNGECDIVGIWFDGQKCTIPWDEVINYQHTDFHLVSNMYLDNGQVTDEGEIVQMIVDFGTGMTETWTTEDIVYVRADVSLVIGMDRHEWDKATPEQKIELFKQSLDRITQESDGLYPDKVTITHEMTEDEYIGEDC